ncbi:MAG: cellulose synthase family protein [Rudaea sp.]
MVWLVALFYILAALILAVFSLNYFVLIWLYKRRLPSPREPSLADPLPLVTVQIPIYNELYVAERVVDAAVALDWPKDRLQIQVLDDSDDETAAIVARRVERYQRLGYDISQQRRQDRSGFKAGALSAGLADAGGDYIAVFDADFVPPRSFLKRTVPYLAGDPSLGLVQTRWGHLNADYSPLTRAQAIGLDGHFIVEQSARWGGGLLMNFNGTAGIWRREAIRRSGGWQTDTLTEDLDLSYRAQLAGWKFIYLPDVVCPAELPAQLHAFKRQQFRWAKGSTQCLIKLAPEVLRSPRLSLFQRVEGLLHLSGYVMNLLMVLLLLTSVPLLATKTHFPDVMALLTVGAIAPVLLYGISQRRLYGDWRSRMRYFPILMLLGVGLSLSDTLAVLEALLGKENSFRRTPKFKLESSGDTWDEKRYRLSLGSETIGEAVLAFYALLGAAIAWHNQSFWALPYLLLYACGFAYTVALGVWHSRPSPKTQVGWAGISE